ncbi:hypothetical protein BASA81_002174 [Batrachochytrium salamandrivorans]|nr:hypothetical protein BASA81_002174 [Batrachochytrium salamandrivorans]
MEWWLSAALMVVGLLLMVSYYYEDGGKIHFGGHFRDSSSGGGDILPPPGYHDDNDTITSNNVVLLICGISPPSASFKLSFQALPSTSPAFTGKCASKSNLWRSCDAPVCSRNHTHRLPNFRLPKTTRLGQPTVEFVHQVLRKAWGETPPAIDLFGKVDFVVPKPLLEGYAVKLVYEHQPCMLGRIFNQYSYLNLPAHTNAEFVVTIDSDCAFHRPVTPDVLFNHLGKLILPTNSGFQSTYWYPKQFHFTHIDDRAWGIPCHPYEVAVKRAVKQGLCLWFASELKCWSAPFPPALPQGDESQAYFSSSPPRSEPRDVRRRIRAPQLCCPSSPSTDDSRITIRNLKATRMEERDSRPVRGRGHEAGLRARAHKEVPPHEEGTEPEGRATGGLPCGVVSVGWWGGAVPLSVEEKQLLHEYNLRLQQALSTRPPSPLALSPSPVSATTTTAAAAATPAAAAPDRTGS